MIYRDSLLKALVVVEHDGDLWLVPRSRGGWSRRLPLRMTDAARAERLKPARDVDPAWLGITSPTEGQTHA
jgi:hypothetical protein